MKALTKAESDLYKDGFVKGLLVQSAFTKLKGMLETCTVGESIIVKKEEWNLRTPIAFMVNQSYRRGTSNKRFVVRELIDNSGWLVLRKQ